MTQTDAAPHTAAQLPAFAGEHYGSRPAVRQRRDGTWQDRSYAEVTQEITRGRLQ